MFSHYGSLYNCLKQLTPSSTRGLFKDISIDQGDKSRSKIDNTRWEKLMETRVNCNRNQEELNKLHGTQG